MTTAITFDNSRHCLQALHSVLPPGDPFPEPFLYKTDGHGLGVVVPDGTADRLQKLARRLGWPCHRGPLRAGVQTTRAVEVFGSQELYVDAMRRGWFPGEPAPREYLLAVRPGAHAQGVLDILHGAGGRRVRVRPLQGHPAGPASQHRSLLAVEGTAPPREALLAADGCWWGPAASAARWRGDASPAARIFFEWPWRPDVNPACLERLPPWTDVGYFLLGPGRVEVVVIPADSPPLEELIAVADVALRPGGSAEARGLRAADVPPEHRLQIKPRLIPRPTRDRLEDRCRALDREARAKEQLSRQLRERAAIELASGPDPAEPIYLHYAEAGRIPEMIREILVDFCDHEEVATLRHLKLNAARLPEPFRKKGHDLHLLTTATTLGGSSSGGRFAWLQSYAPSHSRYGLVSAWARFGLWLFTPDDGRRLVLDPPIRPGPHAAEKLAQAFAPAIPRPEQVVLLNTIAHGGLLALVLRRSDFRPLTEAARWHCAFAESVECVEGQADQPGGLADAFLRQVDADFETVIRGIFRTHVADLNRELTARNQTLTEHLAEVSDLAAHDQLLGDAIRELVTQLPELLNELRRLPGSFAVAEQKLAAMNRDWQLLEDLRRRLPKRDQRLLERLLRLLQRLVPDSVRSPKTRKGWRR
jgi:hypothetical protein